MTADRPGGAVRIVALGHPDRGDDAAGVAVARALPSVAGIEVVRGAADAAALLAQFEAAAGIVAVDCARGGGAPGSILRLDADLSRWPQHRATSSHGNALADALALGSVLGDLPPIVVLAVVGESFALGDPLSAAVAAAIPELARQALQEATCMKPA